MSILQIEGIKLAISQKGITDIRSAAWVFRKFPSILGLLHLRRSAFKGAIARLICRYMILHTNFENLYLDPTLTKINLLILQISWKMNSHTLKIFTQFYSCWQQEWLLKYTRVIQSIWSDHSKLPKNTADHHTSTTLWNDKKSHCLNFLK